MRAARLVLLILVLAGCKDDKPPDLTELQRTVVNAVHEVDSLRSARAASITDDELVDFETFARVCQPVGIRAREIAVENGWVFRQISLRNRNPANVPDSAAYEIYRQFQENSDLDSLWQKTDRGLRYFHRIDVEAACLHCHGAADDRPRFVFERYPEDRAFGFDVGDLRGLYAVTVPDSIRNS